MAVEQTGQPHWHFEKENGKKGRGFCPIHRTNTHDLVECKVVHCIIDKELGEWKPRHDDNGEDGADPDQLVLGYQQADNMVHHIFWEGATYSSTREYKSMVCEVWTTTPGPSLRLKWLEVPFTFS